MGAAACAVPITAALLCGRPTYIYPTRCRPRRRHPYPHRACATRGAAVAARPLTVKTATAAAAAAARAHNRFPRGEPHRGDAVEGGGGGDRQRRGGGKGEHIGLFFWRRAPPRRGPRRRPTRRASGPLRHGHQVPIQRVADGKAGYVRPGGGHDAGHVRANGDRQRLVGRVHLLTEPARPLDVDGVEGRKSSASLHAATVILSSRGTGLSSRGTWLYTAGWRKLPVCATSVGVLSSFKIQDSQAVQRSNYSTEVILAPLYAFKVLTPRLFVPLDAVFTLSLHGRLSHRPTQTATGPLLFLRGDAPWFSIICSRPLVPCHICSVWRTRDTRTSAPFPSHPGMHPTVTMGPAATGRRAPGVVSHRRFEDTPAGWGG